MSWVEKNWKPLTVVGGLLGLSWFAGKKFEEAETFDAEDRDLAGSDLRGFYFVDANLEGANLRGANLSFTDLLRTNLRGAKLGGANLFGAELQSANLNNADLRIADLRNAKLHFADLRNADLRNANLRGANLPFADLRGANLEGADFRGAKLSEGQREMIIAGGGIVDEESFGAETFEANEICYRSCYEHEWRLSGTPHLGDYTPDGTPILNWRCDACGQSKSSPTEPSSKGDTHDWRLTKTKNWEDGVFTVYAQCERCGVKGYADGDVEESIDSVHPSLRAETFDAEEMPFGVHVKNHKTTSTVFYKRKPFRRFRGNLHKEKAKSYAQYMEEKLKKNPNRFNYFAETFDAEGVWRWDYGPMMQNRIDRNECSHRYYDGDTRGGDAWVLKYADLMGVEDGLSYIEAGVKCGICGQERIGSWGINEREGFQITKGEEGRMPRFYGFYGAENFEAPMREVHSTGMEMPVWSYELETNIGEGGENDFNYWIVKKGGSSRVRFELPVYDPQQQGGFMGYRRRDVENLIRDLNSTQNIDLMNLFNHFSDKARLNPQELYFAEPNERSG